MFVTTVLVGALAALAAAQSTVISFTNALPNPAEVGKPVSLTYATTASGPVAIILRKGNPNDLKTVATLTSDATGGAYEWTPASDLESGTDYALQIQQGTEVNYLGPFPLAGGSAPGSSSSSSSAPASTSLTVTATASANGTASTSFTTVAPPYGTANATISRNATLSSATLTGTARPTGSSGAGHHGTTTGPNAAQNTGGAGALMVGGSAIALVVGAVAAVVIG